MKAVHSIRWRLQFWYGLLLLALLAGFGVTAYRLESGREFRHIDDELGRRLPILVNAQRPVPTNRDLREFSLPPRHASMFDDPAGEGPYYYVVWLRHSEHPVTGSTTAPPDVPMPHIGDPPIRQRGNLRESFIFAGPGDCVLVGRSTRRDTAGLRQLTWWLAGAGASVLILGLAVGGWLVSQALKPINAISDTAGKIATGDLTQRINTADTDSELGRLAEVLNSTFARLDAAFTQQARFTADAAHELRTPVSVILTHAQNGLASSCPHEEHHEAFQALHRAAQRMRRLIESLLELARLDAGQEAIRQDPLDLAAAAHDSIQLLQPLAREHQLHLLATLKQAPTRGDSDRLAQVITNVLSNALRHAPPGSQIEITTQQDQNAAILTVTDHGPGISPENLPRIFDRFHRTDRSRSRSSGGTGLGLAISKAITEAHGGTLHAASQPGVATTFTLRLPSAPA